MYFLYADMVPALEECEELLLSVVPVNGLRHLRDDDGPVADCSLGGINKWGVMLGRVSGIRAGEDVGVLRFGVELFLNHVVKLSDSFIFLLIAENKVVAVKDDLGMEVVNGFKFPGEFFELLVFRYVKLWDILIFLLRFIDVL